MDAVSNLIAAWQAARAEVKAAEAAEHPDVVDAFGRTWVWTGRSDMYRHCSFAIPKAWVPDFRFASQAVANNPNYDLCDVCLNGKIRNVPDCRPEWNCSHTMHQP